MPTPPPGALPNKGGELARDSDPSYWQCGAIDTVRPSHHAFGHDVDPAAA
jgi:hypothetical protein